jgi:hypothetical protein
MRSGIFGWSYPPGAATDPNAPYNQNGPYICEVCLCDSEVDCKCEECPICHAFGDPKCYSDGHRIIDTQLDTIRTSADQPDWTWKPDGLTHGIFRLVLPREVQLGRIGRQKLFDIEIMLNLQDEEMYAREMDEGYEVERISDKWR